MLASTFVNDDMKICMNKRAKPQDLVGYVKQISRGDKVAFKIVFDYYFPEIRSFAYKILHEHEYAQEVAQEVMLSFWQMGDQLNDINNPEAFLKTLAKRRCIDMLRRIQRERKAIQELKEDCDESYNETEERIFFNEARRILERGVSLLPPQQRLVYELCKQQGLKYEEVARQMNLSLGTVQTHMKLALKFLRSYIRENSD